MKSSVKGKKEARSGAKAADAGTSGILDVLCGRLFGEAWPMWTGAVILSLLSVVLFIISAPWGASGGFLNMGQNLIAALGVDLPESAPDGPEPIVSHRYAMLMVATFLGALGSALMAREFAVRVPAAPELGKGLGGGLLMGLGAVIGGGCTVSAFYSAVPALAAGGLVFGLGLVLGSAVGVRYLVWEVERHPGASAGGRTLFSCGDEKGIAQPVAAAAAIVLGVLMAALYDPGSDGVLMGFVLVGLMMGVVLQRSRFCIVRAMREVFLTGDARPARDMMAGLLVALLGFTAIKMSGAGDELMRVSPNFWVPALLGGLIFGVGMTLAGGCTVSSTWRAAEGQVKLWFALAGILLGMPLAAEYVRPAFLDAVPEGLRERTFLPDRLGYGGAVCLVLLVILIWYVIVKWNERSGRLSAL